LVPLLVGLAVAGCDDTNGPGGEGTLVVSASTQGEHPDENGYLLMVDDLETLVLRASPIEVRVPAGSHHLQLLDVAGQCVVLPGTSLQVDVVSGLTTSVEFVADCAATGIRVTTTTTGLDIDPSGYRITVDGIARHSASPSGTALVHLDPGEQTIGLTDLAPNCSIEGPRSHRVTITHREVWSLSFAAVCTASSGVIAVAVGASGVDTEGSYIATVDGAEHPFQPDQPTYLSNVAPGDHSVALVPPTNCSVQPDSTVVTVTAGGMVRDTVEASFSVSCISRTAELQVHVSTVGTVPRQDYTVWVCEYAGYWYCYYSTPLGTVDPNGTLAAELTAGDYSIWLADVPPRCLVDGPTLIQLQASERHELTYEVTCP
jgi:hypothetical protein